MNKDSNGILETRLSRKDFLRKALAGIVFTAAGIAAAPVWVSSAATVSFNDNLGILPVGAGGTGASNAAAARNNLGIEEWKEAESSIGTNATSLTISCPGMTSSSTVEVYSGVWGVIPLSVTASNGSITMTFSGAHAAAGIKVRYR